VKPPHEPLLPPDPDADMGELIGAILFAAVCLALACAIAVIGSTPA
jgi:hypothetical protein